MSFRSYRIWLLCLVLLPAGVLAFSADEPARPPEVPVARPVVREVTDYEDFVGRVEASKRVEVRSLVTGYLVKTAFQEGAEVKKGDLLFEIDPRLYQVELDLALAQVELDKAALKLAQVTLAARNQLDQDKAAVDVAIARVKASEASAELHKFNLSCCKVTAPISGRIARTSLTPGDLVKEKETLLAVLVNDKPAYVYFGVDERTYLRRFASMREGKDEMRKPPVAIGLASEEDFPHRGLVDGVEAVFNNKTGTIPHRAVLPNPDRRLVPGMFVRVRLTISAAQGLAGRRSRHRLGPGTQIRLHR